MSIKNKGTMRLISCKELKAKMDRGESFLLVNALEPEKYKAMRIPGSLNVCTRQDVQLLLKPTDEIVVYCTNPTCNRSIFLYELLDHLGYKNIYRFAGGLEEWSKAGYPLETD